MPRRAREISGSGVYHVVLRGINKQTVFYDDEDRKVFLNRLKLIKKETPYGLYAFCLMTNHIHLLIKEEETALGRVMQKILCSFVHWYNRKYERIGNLFQDRYKSEPVNKDSYLLSAVRYIHQNPVKAEMVQKAGDYEWSSHEAYINGNAGFVDTELVLGMLGGANEYENFIAEDEKEAFAEDDRIIPLSDKKLAVQIQDLRNKFNINDIAQLNKDARNELLNMICQIPGASIRQVSRVTGISVSIVRNSR